METKLQQPSPLHQHFPTASSKAPRRSSSRGFRTWSLGVRIPHGLWRRSVGVRWRWCIRVRAIWGWRRSVAPWSRCVTPWSRRVAPWSRRVATRSRSIAPWSRRGGCIPPGHRRVSIARGLERNSAGSYGADI